MKGSRLYLLFLFAFLVIVFVIELNAPHKFVWKPTFDKHDKEPFGSYIFDDVLSSSIDNYTVSNLTFYQTMLQDSVSGGRAFLLTEQNPDFGKIDIEYLYKLIHLGNRVMICTNHFSRYLRDTLCFDVSYDSNHYNWFNMNDAMLRDSIFFGTDTSNFERIFEVFPQIHPLNFDLPDYREDRETQENGENDGGKYRINCDSLEILVWDKEHKALVLRAFIGKGELFLVTTPLMFTNFGVLDGANASYIFRLLSFMKDRPLIRIEAYGEHDEKPQTPLRYILSVTPLRWAMYSTLALALLFMSLSIKRRQRIIPVVNAPPNRTLGFMQLISNLYYQKHDNWEILKMKYMYFCSEVNNQIGVELYEHVPDEPDLERLTEKSGMEKDFINLLLQNIRLSIYREEINDLQLQQYIDGMNELLRNVK